MGNKSPFALFNFHDPFVLKLIIGFDNGRRINRKTRGKVTNGKGTGKKSGKGKKYPRDDDISTLPSGTGMVPVADLINMQRQMESMQATIAALQKQASQTEVQVQMNMELGVGTAAPSAYSSSKVPRFAKPLTFDEKEALSDDINALPPDKLAHVVKVVSVKRLDGRRFVCFI